MIPIRLTLENFLPYRAPDPLRFEGIHLACLTGNNGAGKSSILDAITWVLWGKARAKRDEDLIHLGQKDMRVQLDFEQEGDVYRVIRHRTRSGRGAGTLNLFVQDDGQYNNIGEPSMKATQEKINTLLRLDYDTFINSAFLQQGKADAFTVKTPRERKQILSDILGLSMWERYEERTKERLKELETNRRVMEQIIADIKTQLKAKPGLQKQIEEAEIGYNEAIAAREQAEQLYEEIAHAPEALKHATIRLVDINRDVRERDTELETLEKSLTTERERIAGYEATIARRETIEAGYAALLEAQETDRAFADKLRELDRLNPLRYEQQQIIDEAHTKLVTNIKHFEEGIERVEQNLRSLHLDDLEPVQEEVSALQSIQVEHDALTETVSSMKSEISGLAATNTALRTEMNTIKDRLDRLANATGALCPLCGQPLDEDHRNRLTEELEADGKDRGDTYRTNLTRIESTEQTIAERSGEIDNLKRQLKRLPPLMERAGALREQADAARKHHDEREQLETELQMARQQLENDDYAHKAREVLAELDAERDSLGYDDETHDAVRELMEEKSVFDMEHRQLERAEENIETAQETLTAAENRHVRLKGSLQSSRARLEELQAEIAELEVLVEEEQQRQAEVNRQRTLERTAFQRFNQLEQQLNALDKQRERMVKLEEQVVEEQEKEALHRELRTAFGKNGIPAMVIETAIPELEASANHLLARMTSGRMSLRLNTQREKVTGGVAETLDIEIADELGTRNYEMYSGGEAFRINFAIRVALSQMLARRAGAHLRTLFVDEGFGTQDSVGRDKLVEAIVAIQDDFDLILVITHIDELRDSFPVHIVVEKTSSGSRIDLR